MHQLDQESFNPKELLATVWQHKYTLIAYNVSVFLFVVFIILCWPRGYRSEAKIWIKIGRENSRIDPTVTTGETVSIQESDREDEVKSVIDILSGRGVASGVVDDLGPAVVLGDAPLPGADPSQSGDATAKRPNVVVTAIKSIAGRALGVLKSIDPVSERDEAIQTVDDDLFVSAERKSNVISIGFDSKSPELAQAIVQAVIDRYQQEHARINSTAGSLDFFDSQRRELEQRVQRAAEALRQSKHELGLASIEGQRSMIESQLLRVRTATLDTIQAVEEGRARSEKLSSLLGDQPPTIRSESRLVPNTGLDLLREQLYALQVQQMELASKMSDENPRLQAIQQQVAEAERELSLKSSSDRSETTESINTIYQQLSLDLVQTQSRLAGSEAMLATLGKQEQQLLAELDALNRAEIKVRGLERELQLSESSLIAYSENVEDARIDEALNLSRISNISVAQAPTRQEKPVSPSKPMIALMGMAMMGFGSTTIISGMHLLRFVRRPTPEVELPPVPRVVTVPHRRRYPQINS
jgi:uncharacterized protein involved in exopolysaccharide biosynthesis